ncbi:MAG: OmpW family outer membrane protein [Pseudomonadota bacterium]|nr:OmpW family outer membrane protein [Pseudomonadota bacterium]
MKFPAAPVAALALATAVSLTAPVTAQAGAGDLQVRVRTIGVLPTGDSGPIQPTFPGASLSAGNAVVPEIDLTYFVTDNIGLELIAATTRHQIKGQGALAGLDNAASAWLLPPTLTLQYHFNPEGQFRPYVGAGINWTLFYGERADGSLVNAVGPTKVEATNSLGLAMQAGFDYEIAKNWVINADIKYIRLDTNVSLDTGLGTQRTNLAINPVIIGIGLGYSFNLF